MVYEMFPKSDNPQAQFIGFASDNYAGAHTSVLEWIARANDDYARPYNDDIYTTRFRELSNEIFGKRVGVFPSLNGTGTNVFGLRAVLPRWGTVCAPETAHINTDEAGAPEHMAGLKIMTTPTTNGKMLPEDIRTLARALGDIHSAQPAIVSISNTTERGTFYSADEIGALADTAHAHGMLLHIDGARIFNSIASAGYTSLATGLKEMYGDTNVDVIAFGGTKTGAVSAEAVIVMHPEDSAHCLGAKFSQKQMGQLSSKARYISAQFLALLEDDLALKLAHHSNSKMQELFSKFIQATDAKKSAQAYLSGATSAYASNSDVSVNNEGEVNSTPVTYQDQPDANAFFPTFGRLVVNKLRQKYHFYDINSTSETTTIRLMTSFRTTDAEIDGLIAEIKNSLSNK
jgi:threonine aldolase